VRAAIDAQARVRQGLQGPRTKTPAGEGGR